MTIERSPKRLTTPRSLIEAGLAAPERLKELEAVADRYAIAVTPALAALFKPDDPADPIARQFVPDARELIRDPAESDDPIGDDAMSPVQRTGASLSRSGADQAGRGLRGLLPLLLPPRTGRPGRGRPERRRLRRGARLRSRAHRASGRSILTGGDPLILSPRRIAEVTKALAAIPHVKTLRWHTRLPVAAPERVTKATARALIADGKTTVVAVHANHPRELTEAARAACRRLAAAGAMLVSQSVLLKGVNDDPRR